MQTCCSSGRGGTSAEALCDSQPEVEIGCKQHWRRAKYNPAAQRMAGEAVTAAPHPRTFHSMMTNC